MPELPEMETYKRLLNERIAGKLISDIEINRDKSINVSSDQFISEVKGQTVTRVERRAKHLIFRLGSGKNLLLHLMLGGWMYLGNDEDNPDRTKQVILSFGDEKLYFIGLRLGYLHLHGLDELEKELSDLGPEPLEPSFTYEIYHDIFANRRGMIKTTLVNQEIIAGIGNCYSDEISFEAAIKPTRTFEELENSELQSLFNGMKTTFHRAIEAGGYMDNPLFKSDQKTGGYNKICRVYDREGENCFRCQTPIVKEEVSSRKTFYCPNCQK
ncbi:bifunctional DNA-formamidopyrimidine glycosylase/DNA-(apurinic or apyrimidinic site) lyase [Mesobacillus maritimus]|uniref:bifunctional DNA-formamidopyrimidine glycosylase/DNA-(apurinic or apyrimidinic site) lyase n=1 Tax=Mesobacillus maritimus TaxID=1643336 RepID=UPI00203B04C3|nr:bifunctional DNA-formamidopyrimidine glycosylase/DNA-(apurinic or apyrimidinic site) lyase [Mesobacillus maritimus]MCM3669771.1 bifunctional DNA-formamidopyrimidine glycosylase/DNA-(apurinic or apyrimidinic site) lyase [Mesobacillus maritimus]